MAARAAGRSRAPVCRLLGIDAPIVCVAFGPWDEVDLAAAVCRAGGLGSLGTAVRPFRNCGSRGSGRGG
ncbi:hypothetical protein [Streptomyces sp. NPDC054787]